MPNNVLARGEREGSREVAKARRKINPSRLRVFAGIVLTIRAREVSRGLLWLRPKAALGFICGSFPGVETLASADDAVAIDQKRKICTIGAPPAAGNVL
jgi:hypothetical protein